MPFLGDREEARELIDRLARLDLEPGDEVIIADNTPGGVALSVAPADPSTRVRVVPAGDQRSSYYARNRGAEEARGEWLLFLDVDCLAPRDLVERFFTSPIAADVGAVAGEVVGAAWQTSLAARWTRSRGYLNQTRHQAHSRPYAVTAHLLVRAKAWQALGGFIEDVRSGADSDFSWRLEAAGWRLDLRPEAAVVHLHRETLPELARQIARYAASAAWLNRRYGSAFEPPRLRRSARDMAAAVRCTAAGQRERAAFRAVDALAETAGWIGYQRSNAVATAPRDRRHAPSGRRPGIVVLADNFPEVSETFIAAEVRELARQGYAVRVEAGAHATRPDRQAVRELPVSYMDDEARAAKVRDLAWVVARYPGRSVADLLDRWRWSDEERPVPLRGLAPAARRLVRSGERHLHAHFAGPAALRALRLSRLVGVPYSVTAHAYEVWSEPSNLVEKLTGAAFVTTGCDYNVRHLRALVGPAHSDRLHEVVMGVDGERFRRRAPLPDGRTVVAVGRLVPKKGFRYLVEAAAVLQKQDPLDRLVIAGGGPLHGELAELVRELGLERVVELSGPLDHGDVRDLLEDADLLAMPCVVAPDGDRDSMPVVVKEACAMEVPVVASNEVGLPELVRPEWGRLVAPAEPHELAAAIAGLLALPYEVRVKMGRAGRAHVLSHCAVDRETAKLAALIEGRPPAPASEARAQVARGPAGTAAF